jgi:hypothetical protein
MESKEGETKKSSAKETPPRIFKIGSSNTDISRILLLHTEQLCTAMLCYATPCNALHCTVTYRQEPFEDPLESWSSCTLNYSIYRWRKRRDGDGDWDGLGKECGGKGRRNLTKYEKQRTGINK